MEEKDYESFEAALSGKKSSSDEVDEITDSDRIAYIEHEADTNTNNEVIHHLKHSKRHH